ncbi:MAG: lipid II:glycine glycyltransferase FemX [Anaerolineae bacterium]
MTPSDLSYNRSSLGSSAITVASLQPTRFSLSVVGTTSGTLSNAAWDAFVEGSPRGHLLQCTRWGGLKARFGWQVERLALTRGGSIVAGAQVFFRPIPCGMGQLAYVPMGPLVDWSDRLIVSALLTSLRRTARQRHAFCLKLEPHTPDDLNTARVLCSHGLCASEQTVQERRTIIVDLTGSEEEVWARLNSRTRQKVRSAIRKGVTVRNGTPEDATIFGALAQVTACRHNIAMHTTEYYRAAFDLFVPDHAKLLLATYQGHVLAGVFVFAVGCKALCMYAVSGTSHRELMPTYLLQWEAIKWALQKGCHEYDLCGIPDCDEAVLESQFTSRNDGLWGVYGFKRGFGGCVTRYIGAYDDIYHPAMHWLYCRACATLESVWGETWHRRVRAE